MLGSRAARTARAVLFVHTNKLPHGFLDAVTKMHVSLQTLPLCIFKSALPQAFAWLLPLESALKWHCCPTEAFILTHAHTIHLGVLKPKLARTSLGAAMRPIYLALQMTV